MLYQNNKKPKTSWSYLKLTSISEKATTQTLFYLLQFGTDGYLEHCCLSSTKRKLRYSL